VKIVLGACGIFVANVSIYVKPKIKMFPGLFSIYYPIQVYNKNA